MALYNYKDTKFKRKYRLQNIETAFTSGMSWTNTPLVEGMNRYLVNYDLFDSGATLKPRPGMRAYRGFHNTAHNLMKDAYDNLIKDKDTPEAAAYATALKNAPDVVKLCRTHYYPAKDLTQVVVAYNPGQRLVNAQTNLYEGRILIGAGTGEDNSSDTSFAILEQNNKFNDSWEQAFDSSLSSFEKAFYIAQGNNVKVHGMPLSVNTLQFQHVGTYAYNDNYYYYNEAGEDDSPLCNVLVPNEDGDGFDYSEYPPKALTATEAVKYGYNMLSDDPYDFVNQQAAHGTSIQFTGILPYDYTTDELCLTPVENQRLKLKLFAIVPDNTNAHIIVEWTPADNINWTEIYNEHKVINWTDELAVEFTPPCSNVIIRATAFRYTQAEGEDPVDQTISDSTLAVGFSFNKDDYGSTANINNVKYSVAEASGICYWKNRIIAWGVPEDQNVLFMSDVNDPTYFPYPNNVETFDTPIKYCTAFQDMLLVFTANALHAILVNDDGASWTISCIQRNLYITDWDIHLIQVVKNMVFFKSGNYYYMVVPKSSSTSGELTIAAISKPMLYFFDNFEQAVTEAITNTYTLSHDAELTLIHNYNFLDFEDIHNIYVFQSDDLKDEYVNVDMLYNTVDRTWRCYIFGSPALYVPCISSATQRGSLATLTWHTAPWNNEYKEYFINLIKFDSTNCADYYVPNNLADFNTACQVKNQQMLDTGYREHESNFKKRYREIQFTINNTSNEPLNFYPQFVIDGEIRKDIYSYMVTQNKDTTSSNYGNITIVRELVDPHTAPGATMLGNWILDNSKFPDVSFWKCRFQVSGKGYTPRLRMICTDEKPYELLNISWVYRALYPR